MGIQKLYLGKPNYATWSCLNHLVQVISITLKLKSYVCNLATLVITNSINYKYNFSIWKANYFIYFSGLLG